MSESLPSPTEKLTARVEGQIGWLILDNPARRNALTLAMWQAVPKLVAALERHRDVRVIVVRGAGDGPFASGADISEFETVRATAAGARAYEAVNGEAFDALCHAAKPTIAMIRGFCLGGGLGLALATDLRIAGASAEFGIPAGRLGVGYRRHGAGGGRAGADARQGIVFHRPPGQGRRSIGARAADTGGRRHDA